MYARLSGLDEKLRVLNNDELADALNSRLAELSRKPEKWLPEALFFLLQFSDNPAENSKIEDLEKLIPEPIPAPLTWADIIAEDPLDNRDGIWDNVDFAADGSDIDDEVLLQDPPSSDPIPEPENRTHSLDPIANDLIVPTNDQTLNEIINAQFWREKGFTKNHGQDNDNKSHEIPSINVTEAQLIREVVFMLLGLPTSIYKQNSHGSLTHSVTCSMDHMSQESVTNLLDNFAMIGDELANVRAWINRSDTIPLHQTFQAALATRMDDLNISLSEIQTRVLDPSRFFNTSLLGIYEEVSQTTGFMQQLAEITRQLESQSIEKLSFKILDLLYRTTSMNHCSGDAHGYMNMAILFFDCFRTYLKPVILWMERGELSKHDQVFFVDENTDEVSLEFLWQKKYHLVNDASGLLHAPRFLHLVAGKVFTTGKNVNILKRLGQKIDPPDVCAMNSQQLDYEFVCQNGKMDTLSPFFELFNVALEKWITTKHRSSSQILRQHLESHCGLERYLEALETIYFSSNGALSGVVSRTVFERIDRGTDAWNDGFLLTELFKGVYGPLPCIDANRLAVRPSASSYQDAQSRRRSVKVLGSLRVWYSLPWPIATIIKQDSIEVYQRIFIFTMQTQRAKQMLERLHLSQSTLSALDRDDGENHLIYSLCHRLLWFANSLLAYLTDMVFSVLVAELRIKMKEAEDVDSMIAVHQAFTSRLENVCLISKKLAPIHQAIISLLDLAILFSDAHASFTGQSALDFANHSVISAAHIHRRRRSSNRRIRKEDIDLDSSSDDDDDNTNSGEADVSYISFAETSYAERLANIHASFSKLLAFIIAGLLGVHRAAGEPCWEIFADGLSAGMGKRAIFRHDDD